MPLHLTSLRDSASRPTAALGTLSGGDQRRVAVILALAARPDVVILDEPAAGLDTVSRRELIEALVEFLGDGGERTVLLSTHILADLERLADHIGFMDRGRMLLSGPLDDIHRLRALEGVRVSEQSLGLEDLFVSLMERGHTPPDGEFQSTPRWRQTP
jgi:ABC-type multidrug transport system ATPase subunit